MENAQPEGAPAPQPDPGEPGWDPERIRPSGAERTYDSHDPASMQEALAEVHRRREERVRPDIQAAVDEVISGVEPEDPETHKIFYQDGKDRSAGITAEQAGKDYNAYKQQLAAKYLQDVIAQEQAAQAEAQQPAEPTPQQPTPEEYAELERTIHEQQKQAEIQGLAQAQQNYAYGLNALLAALNNFDAQNFGDIRTDADVARLAQTDPQKFVALQAHANRWNLLQGEIQKTQAAQQQLYQHQFKAYAKAQDEIADRLIPELTHEESKRPLQQAAAAELNDAGFTLDEVRAAYDGGVPFHLRDARVQRVLADAAKWRMSQQRGASINQNRKSVPPVQRPGTAGMARNGHDIAVERLSRQLPNLTGNAALNAAYDLAMAKRAARQGED